MYTCIYIYMNHFAVNLKYCKLTIYKFYFFKKWKKSLCIYTESLINTRLKMGYVNNKDWVWVTIRWCDWSKYDLLTLTQSQELPRGSHCSGSEDHKSWWATTHRVANSQTQPSSRAHAARHSHTDTNLSSTHAVLPSQIPDLGDLC